MRRGETPLSEITIRKYELPNQQEKREVLRKFCMSIGLLQPGDSRETLVDVLAVLLQAHGPVALEEIEKALPKGMAASGIRRHLRRMIELRLVERSKATYRISEGEGLEYAFNYLTRRLVEEMLARVAEYAKAADNAYSGL